MIFVSYYTAQYKFAMWMGFNDIIMPLFTASHSNSHHLDKGATESPIEPKVPKDKRSRTTPSGGMLH